MLNKFIIKKDYNNTRFDKWFKKNVINIPNSLIQKLIRTSKIKVNNKKIKSSFRVSEGDRVTILNLSNYNPTNIKKKIQYLPSVNESKKFENFILHNNEDYIVINKPRGIAVQSGTKNLRNIVDTLKKTKFFELSKPYVVHRLDKETSGVLLVAKNRSTAQFFTSLFRLRKIHKTYLAIVKGEFPRTIKKMDDQLEYFENKKRITSRAITLIRVLKSNNKFSFLELTPQTGRKHQLRKQLFKRGFPIIGDPKYYLEKNKSSRENIMLLHSYKLKFMKNDNKFTYQANYDEIFKKKINLNFR